MNSSSPTDLADLVEIAAATRLDEAGFAQSALGQSLQRLRADQRMVPRITFQNRQGLPQIYNTAIRGGGTADLLVLMHDDVWIDDDLFIDRIIEALDVFDVIGVAGNRRDSPRQPAWWFQDGGWDKPENLSGRIGHGPLPHGTVSEYGPSPAECALLDGVCMAASKSTLVAAGVQFDPQFAFHFYDLDFCRTARQKGLRLGTWPIRLTHQSTGARNAGGGYDSPLWIEAYQRYVNKWDGGRPA